MKKRGNGQGSVYKRGKTYTAEARVFENGEQKRTRKGGFQRKADAINAIPGLLHSLKKERMKTIGFNELIDKLFATQWYSGLSKDKQKAYRIAYNKCTLLHALPDVRLATFEMQTSILCGLSYYPARDVRTLLNKAWELAMRMDCMEKNYAPLLELPSIPQPNKVAMTEDDVRKIADCDDGFKDYVLAMIYMGLRPVEMMSLSVEDVHFEDRYTDGGRKTAKGVPIAIFSEAEEPLKRLCERAVNGRLYKGTENAFYADFYRCLESAKVQSAECRKYTPYACRHTFVTRLTRMGIPQAMIQKASRHTDYKTTQGYTHLDISDVLKAVDDVGNRCGQPCGQ